MHEHPFGRHRGLAVGHAHVIAVEVGRIERIACAEAGDRAARLHAQGRGHAQVLGQRVAAAELELVAAIIGQVAIAAVVDPRIVEVLGASGIGEASV
ncbi:hypothetical protein G6F64_014778 [Rhizopus arrhizus]|uniref:Uncharacterized protein n=1 Tax=Rhizopus oryzae TaxID=64495 RepID=A0A9P7BJH1_RHIOR|nr:hypothetical protein G6F64_014778 [Rhizopus arrhizus]